MRQKAIRFCHGRYRRLLPFALETDIRPMAAKSRTAAAQVLRRSHSSDEKRHVTAVSPERTHVWRPGDPRRSCGSRIKRTTTGSALLRSVVISDRHLATYLKGGHEVRRRKRSLPRGPKLSQSIENVSLHLFDRCFEISDECAARDGLRYISRGKYRDTVRYTRAETPDRQAGGFGGL